MTVSMEKADIIGRVLKRLGFKLDTLGFEVVSEGLLRMDYAALIMLEAQVSKVMQKETSG